MADGAEQDRKRAVNRVRKGERISVVANSMGYTRPWLYKWLKRFKSGDPEWYREQSRRPHTSAWKLRPEVVAEVVEIRERLETNQEFSGAQSIHWEMESEGIHPAPSLRSIGRVLVRENLTKRRRGRYEPKGKRYPALLVVGPGDAHETDFVGPCYLRGGPRFYALNSVDLATGRCASEPVLTKAAQETLDAFWRSWGRFGMPRHQQVDNEMVFYGSLRYPRAMGPLLRLCLLNGVEVWFIPKAEPWRNGVVEKFNDIWRQKFLGRVTMSSFGDLRERSLAFEERHNSRYKYSKLRGRTPMQALEASGCRLRFPTKEVAPRHPLPRPETGRYHLVRFVRSDGLLDVFGEKFVGPPECTYEYARLTVDVERGRLQVFLADKLVDEHRYQRD